MGRVEWIKLETDEKSPKVLRERASEDYRDARRMEQIARAALDELWDFTATGPERRVGALFADGIRFLDGNGREVFRRTVEDAWMQRRLN
jgi:hypothetical protein